VRAQAARGAAAEAAASRDSPKHVRAAALDEARLWPLCTREDAAATEKARRSTPTLESACATQQRAHPRDATTQRNRSAAWA